MLQEIRDSGRPLTEFDIQALEAEIGASLPKDYRDFLLAHNGGRPTPADFPIIGLDKNPFGRLQDFLGIDREFESSDITWVFDVISDVVPRWIVPIGRTGCGDIVGLKVSEPQYGSVWFVDEHAPGDGPEPLLPLAPSFGAFLNGLCG